MAHPWAALSHRGVIGPPPDPGGAGPPVADARSLWLGRADRPCFQPEGDCSLGRPPGALVRASAHGTCWRAAWGRGRAQLCVLPRCQSPLLLELQGPGPRDCEGAREREDGADGSRAPGKWRVPRARPPNAPPCHPLPGPARPAHLHACAPHILLGAASARPPVSWPGRGCSSYTVARPLARPEGPRATSCLFLPNHLFFGEYWELNSFSLCVAETRWPGASSKVLNSYKERALQKDRSCKDSPSKLSHVSPCFTNQSLREGLFSPQGKGHSANEPGKPPSRPRPLDP